MKHIYFEPEIFIESFDNDDIIATSIGLDNNETGIIDKDGNFIV